MSIDLEKLKVEITAQTKDFQKKMDAVKAEAKKTTDVANKSLSEIGTGSSSKTGKQFENIKKQTQKTVEIIKQFGKQAKIDAGLIKPTKEYQSLQKEISKTSDKVASLKLKQDELGEAGHVPTERYAALQSQLKETEASMDGLINKQISWEEIGVDSHSSAFQELDAQITTAGEKVDQLKAKMQAMEDNNGAYEPSDKWKKVQAEITAAKEKLIEYKSAEKGMAAAGTDYAPSGPVSAAKNMGAYARSAESAVRETVKIPAGLQSAMSMAQKFGNVSRAAFKSGAGTVKGFTNDIKSAVGWLKNIGTGFGKVVSKIPLLGNLTSKLPLLNKFSNETEGASRNFGGFLGKYGAMAISAKYMFASAVILGGITAMKNGFNNLSRYSSRTNADLTMLKSSLIRLQNSLATAFAPILTVVAPILSRFIDWLTSGITALAHFFAALTGQKTVVVAKKVTSDYAAGLDKTKDSTDKANDSAKKYQRTLLGFDQINKLDAPDKTKDTDPTKGTLSPSDMFETVEVGNDYADWADKFKEAWEKADFTEIGEIVGEKLNSALENIPWDKIQETLGKIAKSIATFLNGFIKGTDWNLVGKTVAEGLNTGIEFAYQFVTNFDWTEFGKAIGTAVAGFFENIDYVKLAKTFIYGIGGAIVAGITALDTFINDMKDYIIKSIKSGDFWKGVFEISGAVIQISIEILGAAWNLLCDLVKAGAEIIMALVDSGWKSVEKWVETKMGGAVKELIHLGKEGWSYVSTWVKKYAGGAVKKLIYLGKKGWSSVKDWVTKHIGGTIEIGIKLVAKGWKKFKDFFGFAGGGVYKNGSWHPVQAAASGGAFDTGQMFVAREAGPELVGSIGGHTAVMNNDQIVSSVAAGVYSAVLDAMSQNSGNGDVTIVLEGDAKNMFKIIRKEAQNYTNSTGLSAFPV